MNSTVSLLLHRWTLAIVAVSSVTIAIAMCGCGPRSTRSGEMARPTNPRTLKDDGVPFVSDSKQTANKPIAANPNVETVRDGSPVTLSGTAGDNAVLLTWSAAVQSAHAQYIVSRATQSGGPYTSVNGALLSGNAYVDIDTVNGLKNGTTFYYVATYLNGSGKLSPKSNEVKVTPTAANGWWGISIAATGDSPGRTAAAAGASFVAGTNRRTWISADAGVVGSDPAQKSAVSHCDGIWTATWVATSGNASPELYVLDEVEHRSADITSFGNAGEASVLVNGSPLLAFTGPATALPLGGMPTVDDTVDSSDPGHYVFAYDRKEHSRKAASDAKTGQTGVREHINDTVHRIHVFTPAYFTAHFRDPSRIELKFRATGTVNASASLHSGAASSAKLYAAGDYGDEFKNISTER